MSVRSAAAYAVVAACLLTCVPDVQAQKAKEPPPPYIPKGLAGPGGSLTIDVKAGEKDGA